MVVGISQSHAAEAMASANGGWRWSLGGGEGAADDCWWMVAGVVRNRPQVMGGCLLYSSSQRRKDRERERRKDKGRKRMTGESHHSVSG
jgi:hypothetical protein